MKIFLLKPQGNWNKKTVQPCIELILPIFPFRTENSLPMFQRPSFNALYTFNSVTPFPRVEMPFPC